MNKETLLELATRCEQYSDGSRELDKDIAEGLGWTKVLVLRGQISIGHYGHPPYSGNRMEEIPWWTERVDAAAALTPDATKHGKQGKMSLHLTQEDNGDWWAELRNGYLTSFDKAYICVAKTEALARTGAALKARADILP